MTLIRTLRLAGALIALSLSAAQAEDIAAIDFSKTTCKEFVAGSDLRVGLMLHWVDGYQAAKGGKRRAYDPAGLDQVGEKFGLFCGAHPDASVSDAIDQAWK